MTSSSAYLFKEYTNISMVDVQHSPRGLVDRRALHGKPNRSFHYLLPRHAGVSPYAHHLSAGDILLRINLESGSSCNQNPSLYIRPADHRSFCPLPWAWLGIVAGRPSICHRAIPGKVPSFIGQGDRRL